MKKLITFLNVLLLLTVFLFPCAPVYAGEVREVITYTEITISATVPENYEGELIVSLKSDGTVKGGGVVLNADNGYVASINLLGGNVYTTGVHYGNNGDWKCDIVEQLEVPNGEGIELSFTVTDGSIANNIIVEEEPEVTEAPQSSETETNNVPHGEDIDPLTNLLKGEVAIQNFIDKTSFIQNDDTYQGNKFLSIYDGAMVKKDYVECHSENTEEQWDSMSKYEKFVWKKVYRSPQLYMFKAKSLNDFMEDAIAVETGLFKNGEYTDEDIVYDALVELCEWHYSYFQVTGTVYDYYHGAEYILDEETQEIVKIEKEEKVDATPAPEKVDELEELREEVMAELSDEEKEELGIEKPNRILEILKRNIITILILIAVGIAFLVVKRKNRDSGIYDEMEK